MVAGPRTLIRQPTGAVNRFPFTVVRAVSAARVSPVDAGEEVCEGGGVVCAAAQAKIDARKTVIIRGSRKALFIWQLLGDGCAQRALGRQNYMPCPTQAVG